MPSVSERLKGVARVLLLSAAAAYLTWSAWGARFVPPSPGNKTLLEDRVEIIDVEPAEVHPGSTCLLRVVGTTSDASSLQAFVGKEETKILRASKDAVAIEVPRDAAIGRLKVRLRQGERTSKSRDLWVKPLRRYEFLRYLLLGLGFFTLGLTTLSKSLRRLTGRQLQQRVAAMTGGKVRGIFAGIVLGCLSQSMLVTASVALSAVQSRFVSYRGMLRLLIGAQLGSVVVWLLLPGSSEGDIVIIAACGALWSWLSTSRRSKYQSKVLLGVGFLLFGIYQFKAGASTFINLADMLALSDGTALTNGIRNTLAGALFGGLTQGQGPVFALVHQLHADYGLIGLSESLQLLFGAGIGASFLSVLVCWRHAQARRAALHYATATSVAAVLLSTLSPMLLQAPWLHGLLKGPEPLLAAFLLPQALALGVMALLIPRRVGAEVSLSTRSDRSESRSHSSLAQALRDARVALEKSIEMRRSGNRSISVEVDKLVRDAEAAARLALTRGKGAEQGVAVQFSVLLGDINSHARLTEKGLEKDVTFPDKLAGDIENIEALVKECLDQAVELLADPAASDQEQWRAREIRINLAEQGARRSLAVDPARPEVVMHLTQVLASLEGLGNLCFRLQEAINPDADLL